MPWRGFHRQARPRPEGDVTKAPMTEAELRRLAEEKGYRLRKRYELWTDDVTCEKVSVPGPFGTPESLFGPSLHDIEEFLKAAPPRCRRW